VIDLNRYIDKEILDRLSYRSTLGKSLKQISLRKTPLERILQDIAMYRAGYVDILTQDNLIGSRFKSDDSIMRKYGKTLRMGGGFKQCFNDVLGFRLHFSDYPTHYPDYFRVVDLRMGKQIDDGYRAVHLYYQRDFLAYPIELQLWCGTDYQFNIWSHRFVYKYKSAQIGQKLYELYTLGRLKTEDEFLENLNYLEGKGNGR
jgi:putative GTP pyrophosphokinase